MTDDTDDHTPAAIVETASRSAPTGGHPDPSRSSGSTATEGAASDGSGTDAPGGAADGPGRMPGAHPAAHGAGLVGLAVGALGVVFGDIGTSPLYALQTVFALDGHAIKATQSDVYGVISLIFWSITLVVSIKYVMFILRADNDGEGGVMALAALARRAAGDGTRLVKIALILGVMGASLFYGDSVITPAISVLSAVEGLQVASPNLADVVLPIGIAILAALFMVQRFGTHLVGRFFGPIMVVWFLVLAVTGLPQILRHPAILRALSPSYIVAFVADHPYLAFIALGAVVLSITGAEALYADMGHFGRAPIRRAWFLLVFPCLTLNYLGQGALVLNDPKAISSPFFKLAPSWATWPMVVLATVATVIASQAVISGAYSVSRQAVRLGFLPNLTVRHTSTRESGQIYVPAVNWLVFGSVLLLMVSFRSSARLATLYGFAVTGTFLIDTTLFLIVALAVWHWARWKVVTVAVVFGVVELSYFGANVTKVASGGWLPLVIAAVVITVMTTWQRGRIIVTRRRIALEGPLQEFVDDLHERGLPRVPGTAVFPHPTKDTTPLALRQNVEFNQVLHEHVVLVSVQTENVPYVDADERIVVDSLVHSDDGIVHLDLHLGFQDDRDIPALLRQAVGRSEELSFDPESASYFLSRLSIRRADATNRASAPGNGAPDTGTPDTGALDTSATGTSATGTSATGTSATGTSGPTTNDQEAIDADDADNRMATWRKRLFIGLAHNAANPAESFCLPEERTVVMGAHIDL